VPPELVGALGQTLPVTLRATPTQLVITINLQQPARTLGAALPDLRYRVISIYLFGHYGKGRTLVRNPETATTLTSSVTVRACAEDACAKLGPSVDEVKSRGVV
jgi:hypothetical protein